MLDKKIKEAPYYNLLYIEVIYAIVTSFYIVFAMPMIGGNAKMLMFAHISPEAESYVETLSTLKFAQRASSVELGTAHANKESNEIRDLKEQVVFSVTTTAFLLS